MNKMRSDSIQKYVEYCIVFDGSMIKIWPEYDKNMILNITKNGQKMTKIWSYITRRWLLKSATITVNTPIQNQDNI